MENMRTGTFNFLDIRKKWDFLKWISRFVFASLSKFVETQDNKMPEDTRVEVLQDILQRLQRTEEISSENIKQM